MNKVLARDIQGVWFKNLKIRNNLSDAQIGALKKFQCRIRIFMRKEIPFPRYGNILTSLFAVTTERKGERKFERWTGFK